MVENGGYLQGYIAPAGNLCVTPLMPSVVTGAVPSMVINETELSAVSGQSSFTIYPNPTSGKFTLELSAEIPGSSVVRIEIYGMHGEMFLNEQFIGEMKHEFSLEDIPAGIYFIRVLGEEVSGSGKVIKL